MRLDREAQHADSIPDRITVLAPNSGLPEKTGITSEMIPKAGRIGMYTSGCPKNPNRCCHSNKPFSGIKIIITISYHANIMARKEVHFRRTVENSGPTSITTESAWSLPEKATRRLV
jgi:hypothetical protein